MSSVRSWGEERKGEKRLVANSEENASTLNGAAVRCRSKSYRAIKMSELSFSRIGEEEEVGISEQKAEMVMRGEKEAN